jgi:hypothetical protein
MFEANPRLIRSPAGSLLQPQSSFRCQRDAADPAEPKAIIFQLLITLKLFGGVSFASTEAVTFDPWAAKYRSFCWMISWLIFMDDFIKPPIISLSYAALEGYDRLCPLSSMIRKLSL